MPVKKINQKNTSVPAPLPKSLPIPKEQRTQPYWELLNTVLDPELGIGVVDLGLIYDIEMKDDHMVVTMTLTSMSCPVGPSLIRSVQT